MSLAKEKFQLMCETVYQNSVGENRAQLMFEELYLISRSIGVVKPIGWLTGFLNYISPYLSGNPYPQFSLAYAHYEQGRMCAHNSYHRYYNDIDYVT